MDGFFEKKGRPRRRHTSLECENGCTHVRLVVRNRRRWISRNVFESISRIEGNVSALLGGGTRESRREIAGEARRTHVIGTIPYRRSPFLEPLKVVNY